MPSGVALTARWMITTVEPREPMVATTEVVAVVAADAAVAAEMVDAVDVTSAAHIIAMTTTIREGSRAIIEVIPSRDPKPRLHGPPRAPHSLATVTAGCDQSSTIAAMVSRATITPGPETPLRRGSWPAYW